MKKRILWGLGGLAVLFIGGLSFAAINSGFPYANQQWTGFGPKRGTVQFVLGPQTDGASSDFYPGVTNTNALGNSSYRFSNVYSVLGNFSGAITAGSNLAVTGNTTLNGNTTIGDAGTDLYTLNVSSPKVTAYGLNYSTTTDGTGTSILRLDGTNYRVGINNSSPTTALDVTGTGTFTKVAASTVTASALIGLPVNSAPRTNVATTVVGQLIVNTGFSSGAELCMSTGTSGFSWVRVSTPTLACSN